MSTKCFLPIPGRGLTEMQTRSAHSIVNPSTGLVERPAYEIENVGEAVTVDASQPLSPLQRFWSVATLRKTIVVLLFVMAWQLYTTLGSVNPLIFPDFASTVHAMGVALVRGELLQKIGVSVRVLLAGYFIGVALAAVLTVLAVTSRFGSDMLGTVTAMLNPLPAIALLPLSMLWFGFGTMSIIFVMVHSVLWPVALNAHAGFRSVSETQKMVGRNYGIRYIGFVVKILIPAAFPAILSGLKIGWAFAWRTLIAAELVFGAAQGSGGLGWYIFENSQNLQTANVFAGLLTVMIVGVVVENGVFRTIEHRTIQRWGMQS